MDLLALNIITHIYIYRHIDMTAEMLEPNALLFIRVFVSEILHEIRYDPVICLFLLVLDRHPISMSDLESSAFRFAIRAKCSFFSEETFDSIIKVV